MAYTNITQARILPSKLFSTFRLWPSWLKAVATSAALSGWHTMAVRASAENSCFTYFAPTRARSASVTFPTWRTSAWLYPAVTCLKLARNDCSTTLPMLFSRAIISKINELRADSSSVESHSASGWSCFSWEGRIILKFGPEFVSKWHLR